LLRRPARSLALGLFCGRHSSQEKTRPPPRAAGRETNRLLPNAFISAATQASRPTLTQKNRKLPGPP